MDTGLPSVRAQRKAGQMEGTTYGKVQRDREYEWEMVCERVWGGRLERQVDED
jgi:hypothetical protein